MVLVLKRRHQIASGNLAVDYGNCLSELLKIVAVFGHRHRSPGSCRDAGCFDSGPSSGVAANFPTSSTKSVIREAAVAEPFSAVSSDASLMVPAEFRSLATHPRETGPIGGIAARSAL